MTVTDLTTAPEPDMLRPEDRFLRAFAPLELAAPGQPPGWVFPFRKAGLARFAELGLPTTADEDWRFTSLAALAALPFCPVLTPASQGLSQAILGRFPFAGLAGDRLVFVDGHYTPELSRLRAHNGGLQVSSLAAALARDTGLIAHHLGACARSEEHALIALNAAFFTDGAFIRVPAGRVLSEPVHLLFIATGRTPGAAVHPRNLVLAERESQVTVLESYVGLDPAPGLTNGVTELIVGEGAQVEHCKFQDEPATRFHLTALGARLGRQCRFTSHSFALGARLARQNIVTELAGEDLDCVLNGLYLAAGEQLVDHHMIVDHAQPHCRSHEYFNGILAGRARGVFHGRILVRPGAQKTDAKQTNKNLLLSEEATVDTKPQLEIYADDVKCTHGATIGQLNDEAVFYLRSRGLGRDTARRMLVHAFAAEIVERLGCAPVRTELDQLVWNRLEQHEQVSLHV